MGKEEYKIRCKVFRDKARILFDFLIKDYGYYLKHESNKSDSGSIISETLLYTNEKRKRIIKISNSFHPNNNGFELIIVDTSKKTKHILKKKLVFNVPKNMQVSEQHHLNQISTDFRKNHSKIISGKKFYVDAFEYTTVKQNKHRISTLKTILLWLLMVIIIILMERYFQ